MARVIFCCSFCKVQVTDLECKYSTPALKITCCVMGYCLCKHALFLQTQSGGHIYGLRHIAWDTNQLTNGLFVQVMEWLKLRV